MSSGIAPPPAAVASAITSSAKSYHFGTQQMEIPLRYVPSKVIGRGAYGIVCSAVDTITGERVAIKKVGRLFDDLIDAKRVLRELKLLAFVRHPNLLFLRDVFHPANAERENFSDLYMVTDLMETDLNAVLKSKVIRLQEGHCRYFVYQLVAGLHYLHSCGVLHRDLKPANLLTNSECEVKICDFGLARTCGPEMTDYVVTRWYRPPELLLVCDGYTPAIDMWAVGCLTYELFMRHPLFAGKDYVHQITLIADKLGTPSLDDLKRVQSAEARRFVLAMQPRTGVRWSDLMPGASPLLTDLVSKLLVYDPEKRLTAAQALRHPIFSEFYEADAPEVQTAPCHFVADEAIVSGTSGTTIDEGALRREYWKEICRWADIRTKSGGMPS